MSNSKDQINSSTGELEKKVNITEEDTNNIRKYTKHFTVPLPDEFTAALKEFDETGSYESQQEIKRQICHWMKESKHKSFTDPMWDAPKKEGERIEDELEFDYQLGQLLTPEDEEAIPSEE